MNESMNDALGLRPIEVQSQELQPLPEVVPEDSVDADFEYARGHMLAAIDKGQEALSSIVDIAQMSQHPRSFEVVATLVSAVANASKDLLELSKRKQDIKGASKDKGPSTVNQNLFVGNTAELLRILKGKTTDGL